MSETITAAIDADDLRVTRGKHEVLHGLNLSVPRGSVVGLLGPSGCGKTTLMRSIVGVQAQVTGTLRVLGHPAGDAALRSSVGYVTQSPSVYDDLSVSQNLRYFRAVIGAGRADVDRVIEATGLGSVADRLVGTLSGGEQTRVSLAAALLGSPELLVLDEPTVGLDPVLRGELWELFHNLAAAGTTLLVSSHVMDEATRCDRLILMRDGRVLADDAPEALLAATGTGDIESAFIALIGAGSEPSSDDAEQRKQHGRRARRGRSSAHPHGEAGR